LFNWRDGDFYDFGTWDYNIYSNRNSARVFSENGQGHPVQYYSLSQWQSQRGQDLHSRYVEQAGSADPDEDSIILVNTGRDPRQFTCQEHALPGKSYVYIESGDPVAWPVVLDGYSSQILLWDGADEGGCDTPDCGNGVLDPGETCDPPATCPATCVDGDPCTRDFMIGDAQTCDATCRHDLVTGCIDGDGCCPEGCVETTDADCPPGCGDGLDNDCDSLIDTEDAEECEAPAMIGGCGVLSRPGGSRGQLSAGFPVALVAFAFLSGRLRRRRGV
jgi:hypothetical protein